MLSPLAFACLCTGSLCFGIAIIGCCRRYLEVRADRQAQDTPLPERVEADNNNNVKAGAPSSAETLEEPSTQESETSVPEIVALWHIDLLSQRNWLNEFTTRGIELEYRRYAAQLWITHFYRWIILAACAFSVAPMYDLAILVLVGDSPRVVWRPHPTSMVHFYVFAAFFWALLVAVRLSPPWVKARLCEYQQSFVGILGLIAMFTLCMPVLLMPPEAVLHGMPAVSPSEYLDGKWHAIVSSCACALLSCSGVRPLLFSTLSACAFTLWEARNYAIRSAWHRADLNATEIYSVGVTTTTTISSFTRLEVSDESLVSLMHILPVCFVCFVVCVQRDSMLRQNFVILQQFKQDKDKAISALAGEKRLLEVRLVEVEREVSSSTTNTSQHVKFVADGMPSTRPARPLRQKPKPTNLARSRPLRDACMERRKARGGGGVTPLRLQGKRHHHHQQAEEEGGVGASPEGGSRGCFSMPPGLLRLEA